MASITADYIDEQIGYLRTDHEFYIVYDEFDGDEGDLPELRTLLRRAAKEAGLRVHTRVYEGDAVWVYDPDWNPSAAERETIHQARRAASPPPQPAEAAPQRHLRALN